MKYKDLTQEQLISIIKGLEDQVAMNSRNSKAIAPLSISDLTNELFESYPEAIILVDGQGIVHRINDEFTRLFQYTEEEIKGRNIDKILAKGEEMITAANLTKAIESGERVTLETSRYRKDGFPIQVSILGVPVKLGNGGMAVYGIYRDITDWKIAQENLIESQTKYQTLFESATDGIFLMKDNVFVECNGPALSIFHCSSEEIIGNLPHIVSPVTQPDGQDSIAKETQLLQAAYAGEPQFFEWVHKRMDGELFFSEVSLTRIELKGEFYLQAIVRDISQRKKIDNLLKRRLEYIEFISRVSSNFINLPAAEIDTAIVHALKFAAMFSKVERGYILLLDPISSQIELTHEWYDVSVVSRKGLFSYFEAAYMPELIKSLNEGILIMTQRSELPSTPQYRFMSEMLDLLEVKSFIHVPFSVAEKHFGYIGFDATQAPVDWTDEIVNTLKLTGQIIGNAIGRKKTDHELTHSKEKAEESDKLKTAFLASMSHEIRTPMNHIIGFLELLKDTELNQIEREEFLHIIRSSGNNLLRLIDDIIDFAKIETQQLEIENVAVSLNKFLEDMLFTHQDLITVDEKHNLTIQLKIPEKDASAEIITDPQRLQQILTNLLSNAIKFTNNGYIVFGYILKSNNRLQFFVSDTGIGIPKAKQELIFQRFRQLDYGYTRSYGGTGLGLAISKGLIEMLGGEIWVESEEGKGSTFFFTIPYKPVYSEVPEPMFTEPPAVINWSDKNILIVEDDEMNTKFLKIILSKTGAKLFYSDNGQEAVEMAQKTTFNLILMDIQIPLLDGYQATLLIKSASPSTIIIAQTAHAMLDERTHCLEAGCDDYLAKPINRKELLAKIQFLFDHNFAC
ncbi:MAG: PAS domain S-box protein [Bacteroidales bacterium]